MLIVFFRIGFVQIFLDLESFEEVDVVEGVLEVVGFKFEVEEGYGKFLLMLVVEEMYKNVE